MNLQERNVLLLYFSRFAQHVFLDRHSAAGITDIVQFRHFGFAHVPWVGDSDTAIFTGIGPLDLLGGAEMSFFGGHHPASLAFIYIRSLFCCHRPFLLSHPSTPAFSKNGGILPYLPMNSKDSNTFAISWR